MRTTIILVHGRSWKPPEVELMSLYSAALTHGLERDHPECLPALASTEMLMAYYGDLSAKILRRMRQSEPALESFGACFRSLNQLKAYSKLDFFNKTKAPIPAGTRLREQLADKVGDPYARIGLSPKPAWSVAPDLRSGLDANSVYGKAIRGRLRNALRERILAEHHILIMAHSLGSVLAWDVCWDFSWGEPMKIWPVDWITFGSPLGSELVKKYLRGGNQRRARHYPKIVRRWDNLSAWGDFVCHDKSIVNDFSDMHRYGACTGVQDHQLFNLAPEASQSDPQHSPLGYLIHPTTSTLVAEWLKASQA